MFGSFYVLEKLGRVGREFFLLLLSFNSHDSLELDGFNTSLPCCKILSLYAVIVLLFSQKLRIMVGELIFRTARLPLVALLIK